MTLLKKPTPKTQAQYSFVAVEYAAKWFQLNGFVTEVTSDDLRINIEGYIFEVSHSEIRKRATAYLESELEGVQSY